MEEERESESAANSEIRFITLELMKLAQRSGKTFDEVAAEYMRNAEKLQLMLRQEDWPARRSGRGAISKNNR
ncbi:MAG: hypothetical protein N3G22_01580 [Candidatus Micrarchaeota archaeon]|nr:hypothetical protein [Candidatus Micrarchaeota archaeon]